MTNPMPENFWMMLAVDVVDQNVSILGWSDKPRDEALRIARQRAKEVLPDAYVNIFSFAGAKHPGDDIHAWLVALKIPHQDAAHIVRDIGKMALEGMEEEEQGSAG